MKTAHCFVVNEGKGITWRYLEVIHCSRGEADSGDGVSSLDLRTVPGVYLRFQFPLNTGHFRGKVEIEISGLTLLGVSAVAVVRVVYQ